MAQIICFKKEEKLAILKIMIEINNYYSLGRDEYIIEVANYLNVYDEISVAYNMPLLEAQKILEINLKYEYSKQNFAFNIYNYLLRDNNYKTDGVFKAHCRYAKSIINNFINYDFSICSRNPLNDYISLDSPKLHDKQNAVSPKNENIDKKLDLNSVKEELRKELREELRKELKEFIHKEISEELRNGINNILQNRLNETLYKDL